MPSWPAIGVASIHRLDFTATTLADIDQHAVESGVDLWADARQQPTD